MELKFLSPALWRLLRYLLIVLNGIEILQTVQPLSISVKLLIVLNGIEMCSLEALQSVANLLLIVLNGIEMLESSFAYGLWNAF